ncbi:MAG: hypothetical protein J0I49_01820 [Pseudonocardia sp.]|jgi:hypothetical protein|nr:hypothetical protein [Pseudonocardia sp.]MBN9096846.1 hypothetical protein [Pseudonocardia sp.]
MNPLAVEAAPVVDAPVSTVGEGSISAPMVAALEGVSVSDATLTRNL